ncbi:MAG TPA: pyridoxamine 5'-phosphate oxidase family protein [Anaerolineales bacterium]|nr:pyridoxamine 5'-phosphate oxidase family protein [Anaerolineales bacterium]
MIDTNFRKQVANWLAGLSCLSLATVSPDGLPQVVSVFFAADDDLDIFFASSGASRHAVNIENQPRVAVSFHTDVWSWEAVAGVQLEGQVKHLQDSAEIEYAQLLLRDKFPWLNQLTGQYESVRWYCFTADWLRVINNQNIAQG